MLRPLPRGFADLRGRGRGKARTRGRSDQSQGILLLLLAVFTFTAMDAVAKYLGESYPPAQVVWARFMGNLVVVLAVYRSRFLPSLRTCQPAVQLGRGVTQLAAVSLFFTAIQHMGIAEATAIMDINPVLITLGGALFLGERIGWRRVLGITAALLGAMLIIKPGMGVFEPAAVLPLVGAVFYAAGALLTRVARADPLATSIVWSVTVGSVGTCLVVPFFWTPIDPAHLWAFGVIGVLGAISQTLLIKAFSLAEAGAIAPFGYTGLIWAGLWGWVFWGAVPDGLSIAGAAIIVAAGLYVWARETRLQSRAAS